MNPRQYLMLLFGISSVLGGILAFILWNSFSHLGGWAMAGIFVIVWIAAGLVTLYLIRRQNRRR
jgi:ABC-type sulfate transport system permease subunit